MYKQHLITCGQFYVAMSGRDMQQDILMGIKLIKNRCLHFKKPHSHLLN